MVVRASEGEAGRERRGVTVDAFTVRSLVGVQGLEEVPELRERVPLVGSHGGREW